MIGQTAALKHNREAVFTWKRGCKKNIIVSVGYRLHLPNITSADRLWNQPGDYSQSQQRNIRMSMNEYISLILIGLHVNPPANSSEQAGVDQICWTFVAGKL